MTYEDFVRLPIQGRLVSLALNSEWLAREVSNLPLQTVASKLHIDYNLLALAMPLIGSKGSNAPILGRLDMNLVEMAYTHTRELALSYTTQGLEATARMFRIPTKVLGALLPLLIMKGVLR